MKNPVILKEITKVSRDEKKKQVFKISHYITNKSKRLNP